MRVLRPCQPAHLRPVAASARLVAFARAKSGDFEGASVPRRLLVLSGVAGAAALLSPCSSAALVTLEGEDGREFAAYEVPFYLKVVALQTTVPSQTVLDFQTTYRKYAGLQLAYRNSSQEIYAELAAGGGSGSVPAQGQAAPANADLVSLGDQWLAPCIQRGLLRPFPDAQLYRYWEALSPAWRELVQRDSAGLAATGAPVWGVPYRWGCTLIAYRKDKFQEQGIKPIRDWQDLLQPKLAGRLAFMDSPRDFVGAALKSLGLRYNSTSDDLARHGVTEDMLVQRVAAFRRQIRVISDSQHVSALYGGDVWATVGNSLDIMQSAMQLRSRFNKIDVVAPASGTALWADLWVRPNHQKEAGASPLIPLWVEQFLHSGRETTRLGLQLGFRPYQLDQSLAAGVQLSAHPGPPTAPVPGNSGPLTSMSLLDAGVLSQSEFLLPLNKGTNAMYNRVLASLFATEAMASS